MKTLYANGHASAEQVAADTSAIFDLQLLLAAEEAVGAKGGLRINVSPGQWRSLMENVFIRDALAISAAGLSVDEDGFFSRTRINVEGGLGQPAEHTRAAAMWGGGEVVAEIITYEA